MWKTIVLDEMNYDLSAFWLKNFLASSNVMITVASPFRHAPTESLPQQSTSTADYAATDDDNIIYTVKSGDSVSKIAQRFNVSVNNIRKIKGRDSSLPEIYPGEQLLIVKK